MFQLWIRCLFLSVQYVWPLIQAINLLRKPQDKEEPLTKIMVYFMIQAIVCFFEYYFLLWMIPGFKFVKAATMIWLRFPQTEGALYLYFKYFEQWLTQLEVKLQEEPIRKVLE